MQATQKTLGRWSLLILLGGLLLSGCQVPPDIKQLQDENSSLQQRLTQSKSDIDQLQANKLLLEKDVAELHRVISVLGEEKSSRVEESTSLRGEVRKFVQRQIDSLKQFLLAADLVDYVGGELVERSNTDEEPKLIVDLMNAVPHNGTLTGVGGYFQAVGSVSVKVLRPVGDNLVVIWSSQPIAITERGQQRLKFSVVVGVEQGDYLAYYLDKPGMLGFDKGTGDTRYLDENVAVGTALKRTTLGGEKAKRAYSVGVYGLLESL